MAGGHSWPEALGRQSCRVVARTSQAYSLPVHLRNDWTSKPGGYRLLFGRQQLWLVYAFGSAATKLRFSLCGSFGFEPQSSDGIKAHRTNFRTTTLGGCGRSMTLASHANDELLRIPLRATSGSGCVAKPVPTPFRLFLQDLTGWYIDW